MEDRVKELLEEREETAQKNEEFIENGDPLSVQRGTNSMAGSTGGGNGAGGSATSGSGGVSGDSGPATAGSGPVSGNSGSAVTQ